MNKTFSSMIAYYLFLVLLIDIFITCVSGIMVFILRISGKINGELYWWAEIIMYCGCMVAISFFAYIILLGLINIVEIEMKKRENDRNIKERSANAIDKLLDEYKKQNEALRSNGDIIIAGPNSNVINRSTVIESFNLYKNTNPELASAIAELVSIVEAEKNSDAIQATNKLIEEINGRKDKFTMKLYWETIVKYVPIAASASTIVKNITSLFLE